jgi:hypothetical protein
MDSRRQNMNVPTIKLGNVNVSRFIIGGNPFSGFSHQTQDLNEAMRHWYTTARIKEELRRAESLGINTVLARADHHIIRVLMEYWDEGGKLQWIAQTCPEVGTSLRGVQNAISGGATAAYVHGGRMDYLLANDQLDEAAEAVAAIQEAGLPAGVAAHNPAVIEWAEENIDCDFYMCCYYWPTDRSRSAEQQAGQKEVYDDADRDRMVELIAGLGRPAIHYKILAAGRKEPKEAFAFAARHLRPQDAVCVGIYSGDKPDMLDEDLRLFLEATAPAAAE